MDRKYDAKTKNTADSNSRVIFNFWDSERFKVVPESKNYQTYEEALNEYNGGNFFASLSRIWKSFKFSKLNQQLFTGRLFVPVNQVSIRPKSEI